jgi:hypothetical protein
MNQQVNVRYNALDSFLNEATGTDSSSSFVLYAILSPLADCHHLILLPDLFASSYYVTSTGT